MIWPSKLNLGSAHTAAAEHVLSWLGSQPRHHENPPSLWLTHHGAMDAWRRFANVVRRTDISERLQEAMGLGLAKPGTKDKLRPLKTGTTLRRLVGTTLVEHDKKTLQLQQDKIRHRRSGRHCPLLEWSSAFGVRSRTLTTGLDQKATRSPRWYTLPPYTKLQHNITRQRRPQCRSGTGTNGLVVLAEIEIVGNSMQALMESRPDLCYNGTVRPH